MKQFFLLLFTLTQLLLSAESTLLTKGAEAPAFVLATPSGTREYLRTWCGETLAKPYLNKVHHRVIVSFWSTTCLPCMKEIPDLHKFASSHASDSVKIFLVNLDNMTSAEVNEFAKAKEWTLPILLDPYQSVAKRYNITALPTIYVISPTGTVEHAFTGIPPTTTADQFLDSLIYKTDPTHK